MDPEIIRGLERILAVLIGGFSVFLGFRLFLALPEKTDSDGNVVLPGGVDIRLSRIGPGAFFALFGCAVVAVSFHQQVTVHRGPPQTTPAEASVKISEDSYPVSNYTGMGPIVPAASAAQGNIRISDVRQTISSLNELVVPLSASLSASERNSVRLAVEDSKLALLETVWDEGWGRFSEFRSWVRDGQQGPLPEDVSPQALGLFNRGLQSTVRRGRP